MPPGIRFTLRQLLAFVALSAVFMAAARFSNRDAFEVLHAAFQRVGLAVLFYNLRLTEWMWVVIAGYFGPMFFEVVIGGVMELLFLSPLSRTNFLLLQFYLNLAGSILLVVGFAFAFQSIRRKLVIRDNFQRTTAGDSARGELLA